MRTTNKKKQQNKNLVLWALIGAGGMLALVFIMASIFRSTPNSDLARTVAELGGLAREAHEDAMWASRMESIVRVLVLLAGVACPLAIVWLIYRARSGEDLTAEEIITTLEKHNLLSLPGKQLGRGDGRSSSPEIEGGTPDLDRVESIASDG